MVLSICRDCTDIPCKEKGTNARYIVGHQKDLMTNLLATQVEFISKIRGKNDFQYQREETQNNISKETVIT